MNVGLVMRLARWLCTTALVVTAACGSEGDLRTEAAAPTDARCDRTTAFAEALRDTGLEDDTQPSASPSTLASRSDVVLAGRLTGELAHRDAPPNEPVTSWVAFEVEASTVAHGAVAAGDTVYVAVPYDPAHRQSSEYEELLVAGLDVVVFGDEIPDPPAELFVGFEGFATACEDGPPVGRVGTSPEWRSAATLAALFDSADDSSGQAEVTLWHCGIDTIMVDDRRWEVPNDEEPFDATNAPRSFAGTGTIERVSPDELRYVDESGVILRFVPDDGTDPPCG